MLEQTIAELAFAIREVVAKCRKTWCVPTQRDVRIRPTSKPTKGMPICQSMTDSPSVVIRRKGPKYETVERKIVCRWCAESQGGCERKIPEYSHPGAHLNVKRLRTGSLAGGNQQISARPKPKTKCWMSDGRKRVVGSQLKLFFAMGVGCECQK